MNTQKIEREVQEKEKSFEKCVMCGELTSVPKDLHIDFRPNYIEGAGQLCTKCAK